MDYLKHSERIFRYTRVRDILVEVRTKALISTCPVKKISLKFDLRVVINVPNKVMCVMRPLLYSFVM
jgi:hypothetical protein